MTHDIASLISDNLDIWTEAAERRARRVRGGAQLDAYGIQRLRTLIVGLAVRGKLVPQERTEEPAQKLLKRIEAEKRRLATAGATPIPLPSAPGRWPFELPAVWAWTQLGCVTNYGQADKVDPGQVDDNTWVLELEDVEKGTSRLLDRVRHVTRKFQSQKSRFRAGDVVYGKLRPYLDKVIVADEDGVCTTEMIPMRGYLGVEPNYLKLFLKSAFFVNFATASTHGMNLPRLGTEKARQAPFALPPSSEQRRIVEKVDELMALCDALEEESEAAYGTHEALIETLLTTLIRSREAEDVAASWARLVSHFDAVFTTSRSIDSLKQTVLDLAVRGQLTTPSATDEPAVALIQDWKHSKRKALESGDDRRIKEASSPKEPPFALPKHWAIESFENIFLFVDYRGNTPRKTENGVPLITAKNVRMGYLDREPREFISEDTYEAWMTRGLPRADDLFFTTEAPLGNVCVNDVGERFAVAQRVICLQPYGRVNTRFYMMAIMSRSVQRVLYDEATGMTARGIKAAKLKPIALPVPPEAEQHRIVAWVDALFAVCDALKLRIAEAAATRRDLADAIVKKAAP